MAYVSSNYIHVFPAVNRGDTYVKESRVFTEQLLTNLVNNLLDSKSFVVEYVVSGGVPTSLSFNIDGYFFRVDAGGIGTLLSNGYTKIYAKLSQTGEAGAFPYHTLSGDDEGEYKGVEFITTNDSVLDSDYLLLLHRNSALENWSVPQESQMKYDSSKILGLVKSIDGGEI